jgi:hypothetical protein
LGLQFCHRRSNLVRFANPLFPLEFLIASGTPGRKTYHCDYAQQSACNGP